jgi:tRNA 2-thiouridine synthesizing protein A
MIEVDARGLRCPLPVIRLAEAARDAPAGTSIVVLASDPAARHDIPAWCRMRHHELREMSELEGTPAEGTPAEGTQTEVARAEAARAEGAEPAYLRFVVMLLSAPPQGLKAGGSDSGNARPSRSR